MDRKIYSTATIYIQPTLKMQAKAIAESRKRSLSEYISTLIERDLRDIDRRKQESNTMPIPATAE